MVLLFLFLDETDLKTITSNLRDLCGITQVVAVALRYFQRPTGACQVEKEL